MIREMNPRQRIRPWPILRRLGVLSPLPEEGSALEPIVRTPPPWIYPPPMFEQIDRAGYVALPAINAAEVTIVTFTVPPGRNGVIRKIANNFIGGGWVEGSGDVVWRITVDTAAVQGYEKILTSLGNPSTPTEIPGFRIYEGQVIAITGFNDPTGANGGVVVAAGQRLGGRFIGWHYPRELEDETIWI